MKLDSVLLSDYLQKGIVFPLRAISESKAREAFEKYLQLCPEGKVVAEGENRLFGHLLHPWIAELVSHPAILDAVRALIGPNVLVWVSEFNTKAAMTENFFSWHQDLYHWQHQYGDPRQIPMLTAWLALTPSDETNGGMQVVEGSHRELVPHESKPSDHNLLTRAQTVQVEVADSDAVMVNLAAGEFSLHHPMLFHASPANTSDQPRTGLVIRYMAPEVVPPVRPAYAWLVSGVDSSGNWDHVAPIDQKNGAQLRQDSMASVQKITGARFK